MAAGSLTESSAVMTGHDRLLSVRVCVLNLQSDTVTVMTVRTVQLNLTFKKAQILSVVQSFLSILPYFAAVGESFLNICD